jgi:23S rRNA (adenine2503-C2)-methyltransferase
MDNQKKCDILSLDIDELSDRIKLMGEKGYRANQIFEWLSRGVKQFSQMTNLSVDLRYKLEEAFYINRIEPLKILTSEDNSTIKYLFLLMDGNIIESVRMKYRHGSSVCISTQAGCRMNCGFCASGCHGLNRNLTSGEIYDQVIAINKYNVEEYGQRVSNIVIMGTGEPLDNYDNLLKFLRIVNRKAGLNIGYRNITLSTCGLVEKIYSLAQEDMPINLSISLHAPEDSLRRRIMPIAHKYSIDDIIRACNFYFEKTGRRITYEYILIKGLNDQPRHSLKLAETLAGTNSMVNLIPLNPVEGRKYETPSRDRVKQFRDILEQKRIPVTVRREMGADINAACGQLRGRFVKG